MQTFARFVFFFLSLLCTLARPKVPNNGHFFAFLVLAVRTRASSVVVHTTVCAATLAHGENWQAFFLYKEKMQKGKRVRRVREGAWTCLCVLLRVLWRWR